MKINTTKPVRFYDDRGKHPTYIMKNILFENDELCLCELFLEPVLFNKETGEVLTTTLMFYYAENF